MNRINVKMIYIDVCALSRPFDEQDYLRVRIETDAVNLILSKIREGIYKFLVSPIHRKGIESIPDILERVELETLLDELGQSIKVDMCKIRMRAEELIVLGFGIADAAHVAFAEQAGAQFISCDDKLIKKCISHKIDIWCGNPVGFCEKEELK